MRKATLAALIVISAATARAQTMGDVLRSVESNNMELKALQKGNEAADLETRSENTLEALSVEYSPFFDKGVKGVASSEMVVSQGFDFPTLYGARKKAARLQREARDTEYMAARRDVLLEAKNVCLDLIHMNKQKAVLEERRLNADRLLARFQEKYDGGEATALELNKVKMERMNLEAELAQARTDRATALQRLRALNGGLQIECTDTVYPPLPAGDDGEMYDRAVSSDLTVRAAKAAVRAAEQGVKVSRQGWIPKLEVGYRRNTEGPDAVHGFLVGGSIPLFANKNKVKSAKARHTEAQLQQAEAGIKAENDARALVEEMRLLRDAAKTFDVPLMRQTLALLGKAVSDGEMSVTDFYTEADYVYRNLLAYMAIERKYHGIIADLCKNDL